MPIAIVADEFGAPDVLHPVEVPALEPRDGEVVIAVRAAGVNPSDAKRLRGEWGGSTPIRLGSEVAGVVTAVGADAVGAAGPIALGDEVIAYRVSGGFAAEVRAKAADVFPKPASLSWAAAAGLLLTGVTAFHLVEATGVGAGDTVLVHGASGSVGLAAVQLAKQRGARVIGTTSPQNALLVAAAGAEPVAYGFDLAYQVSELAPGGVTVALDTVGTEEALDVSARLVADRRRIATINGFAKGAELGVQLLGGGPGADPGTALRNGARLGLVELAGSGELKVHVGRAFPLAEAAAALELLATGHPGGKLVLVP
ncbi:quinone oxidoreductase family protein [Agromyces seonyuensis]|uniref:Zinc-binding dehydrogenase n=1 Tax=Agromyces seonyuensis TaxID=2662446 RepID=A0A6I4P334_9MICO|nr:NADP-dependent oxidoreductase [Agromyces seonyuensis]MWC00083.1 zinc-binding dehydrogenase [Agromyces seonyuensis]